MNIQTNKKALAYPVPSCNTDHKKFSFPYRITDMNNLPNYAATVSTVRILSVLIVKMPLTFLFSTHVHPLLTVTQS